MQKIFLTGIEGFILSNLARYLHNRYSDVKIIGFDCLTYAGQGNNLIDLQNSDRFFTYSAKAYNVNDFEVLDYIIKKESPDIIIHGAAHSHVDNSLGKPDEFVETNIIGTYNVLKAAKNNQVQKLIHFSTDETYRALEKNEVRTFKETDEYFPSSVYAQSKACGDLLVRSHMKFMDIPGIIIRPCNVYGPYQMNEKFIPRSITDLLENKKIQIYGMGSQVREWIYISDFCSAFDTIMNKGTIGEIYNIATGSMYNNRIVASMICELMHIDNGIEFIKCPRGALHDFAYASDCSKLLSLGWKPEVNFKDGLKKTIDWYINNFDWWRKLKQ